MAREYEGIARALASKGRYGDTMLMHVNPIEVELLNRYSPGGITVNPDTGQAEAILPLLALLGLGGLAAPAAAAAPVIASTVAPIVASTVAPTLATALGATIPTAVSTGAATGAAIAPEVVAAGLEGVLAAGLPEVAAIAPEVAVTAGEVAAAGLPEVGTTVGEVAATTLPEVGVEAAPYALGEGTQLASNVTPGVITDVAQLPMGTSQALHGAQAGAVSGGGAAQVPLTGGQALNAALSTGAQAIGDFAGGIGGAIGSMTLPEAIMAGSLATGAGTMIAEEVAGDEGPPEGWDSDEDPGPSSYAGPASWSGDITGDPSGPAPWAGDITGEASPPFSPGGGGYIASGDPSDSPYVQSGDLGIPEEGIFGTEASPLLESPDLSGYESPPGVYETGGEGLGALAEAVEPLGGGIAEGIPEGMDIGEVMAGFEELKSGLGMTDITIEEYIAMLNQQSYGGLAYG